MHVNFRGYPGRTASRAAKRTHAGKVTTTDPCFATRGQGANGGIVATVYTVNQGADQWHILFAWRHAGSLYTVSEHVITPYDSASRVLQNLKHLLSTLVLVQPRT